MYIAHESEFGCTLDIKIYFKVCLVLFVCVTVGVKQLTSYFIIKPVMLNNAMFSVNVSFCLYE
jgi:hypothetical protein